MKYFLFVVLICINLHADEANYPIVTHIKGQPEYKKAIGDYEKLKVKTILREKAFFKVPEKSLARIELSASSYIIILENTELELPVIEWGSGDVTDIILKQGKVFYACTGRCTRTIKTSLSSDAYGPGEYFFTMDNKKPAVGISVVHGVALFRGLENEESVSLAQADQAQFVGKTEDGQVLYDVLLKGRKVARGKLEMLAKMSEEEIANYRKAFDFKLEAEKAKKMIQAKRTKDQICERPFAKFNECVWGMEKSTCVRKRCNANGEWVDAFDYKGRGPCESNPKVAPCNY